MNKLPILLACGLASASANAEEITYEFEARVVSVFSLGGTTDAQAQFNSGDTMTLLLTYETDTPPNFVNPFDAIYEGALVEAAIEYSNGFAFIAHDGYLKVTDGYPSWDSISWEARDQGIVDQIDAPTVGDAKLVDAASSLVDTTKTALTSKALIPLPPFSAFTGSYLNLVFLPADGSGGRATYVNGRITSLDRVITRPTYSCSGFRSPMDDHPVTIRKFNRALPLKASLAAADGSAVVGASVVARPVVSVTYTAVGGIEAVDVTSETAYVGLGEAGAAFVFEDGEWRYNLKGQQISAPGTYMVTMTSPDQNEYVIDPACVTSIVVGR